jgi:site-specific DNA recombinase
LPPRSRVPQPHTARPYRCQGLLGAPRDRFPFGFGDEGHDARGQVVGLGHGLMDAVVAYKIDRLSRSLMDFSKLVEVFDRNGVTFVSVTQSFNTTTSMGRLTLNILLSFAQLEREVTPERIRDKVLASRMKDIWMGGCPPLGYEVKNRKLVENPTDTATVRWVFARFLEIGSATELARDLTAK